MEQQNMDFNVSEATRFLEYYKKKKAITKAGFLEELIKTNNNFNGKRNFRQQVRRISEIVMPYGTMRRSCVKWIYKKIRRII